MIEIKKCLVCNDSADHTLSFDLDIPGFPTCIEHVKVVREALNILVFLGEEEFNQYLEEIRLDLHNNT